MRVGGGVDGLTDEQAQTPNQFASFGWGLGGLVGGGGAEVLEYVNFFIL